MNLCVIGMGLRARCVLKLILEMDQTIKLTAVCDIADENYLLKLIEKDGIILNYNPKFYNDLEDLLNNEKDVDAFIIGTRCSLHAKIAAKLMPSNKPIFMEKPVAINIEDYNLLKKTNENYKSQFVVSFPLRFTPIIQKVKELIDSDLIGKVSHVLAINYVTYGGAYYHSWYRDVNETGGLFLQKATHDFDYINYLIEDTPVRICAEKSLLIMKGDMPWDLKCENCDEKHICVESYFNPDNKLDANGKGEFCCFAVDSQNEDSGSAIIKYKSGMHVVYTQNFFVRNRKMARRGAILTGKNGSIEFDFVSSTIKYISNYTEVTETIFVENTGNHSGGDSALARNFIDVMNNRTKSNSPLKEGLLSALMCIKATESAQRNEFTSIIFDIDK